MVWILFLASWSLFDFTYYVNLALVLISRYGWHRFYLPINIYCSTVKLFDICINICEVLVFDPTHSGFDARYWHICHWSFLRISTILKFSLAFNILWHWYPNILTNRNISLTFWCLWVTVTSSCQESHLICWFVYSMKKKTLCKRVALISTCYSRREWHAIKTKKINWLI